MKREWLPILSNEQEMENQMEKNMEHDAETGFETVPI